MPSVRESTTVEILIQLLTSALGIKSLIYNSRNFDSAFDEVGFKASGVSTTVEILIQLLTPISQERP